MPDAVINAERLSKEYLIGHQAGDRPGETLREALTKKSASFAQRIKDTLAGRPIVVGTTFEKISALCDVSFSVALGEVVGIIGRNGAGKSTLLKILSRITKPSTGRVTVRGRVASLLEVGTGFHSELTGRENIFLNGAILGMTRADIRRRFDEIVAFAEVDRFLDTPVKRYSTGMYVRLAFAVAAHLEPDILVVDEVLAVGDAQFQKKCLGKMEEVASQKGRTILFVSHQMGMITSLCPRAILLDQGRIEFDGGAADAIAKYYTRNDSAPFALDYTRHEKLVGDQFATLHRAWIEDVNGKKTGEIDIRSDFKIKMQFALNCETSAPPVPNFHFYNSQGQCAFVCGGQLSPYVVAGIYESACLVPGSLLNNDIYFIDLAVTFMHAGNHVSFHERAALSIVVIDPIKETLHGKTRNGYSGPIPGVVRPQFDWTIRRLS
jgi:lipopolysaccharide transport system ATP-binding protein